MKDLTKEEINVLSSILQKLSDDEKHEEIKKLSAEETFEKFWNEKKNLIPNMTIKEFAKLMFMQGTFAENDSTDISIEEVIREVESAQFIENVKDWMNGKGKSDLCQENPFVTVIKKVCPCANCQAHQDMYCDGDPACEVDVEEKINVEELIGNNPQVI